MNGHVGALRELLKEEYKANIESTNNNKDTALHFAAWKGHKDAIGELLKAESRAKIEATTEQGNTALHVAAWYDKVGAVRELLIWGANVEAQNNDGKTALTVGNGHMKVFINNFLVELKKEKAAAQQVAEVVDDQAKPKQQAMSTKQMEQGNEGSKT